MTRIHCADDFCIRSAGHRGDHRLPPEMANEPCVVCGATPIYASRLWQVWAALAIGLLAGVVIGFGLFA